jgi:hypothetical protein
MNNDAWKAFCDFAQHPERYRTPTEEPWDVTTVRPKPKRTRERKMTLDRVNRQAAKAGVTPSSVTLNADGSATVHLNGQATPAIEDEANEWDVLKVVRQ